MSLQLFFCVFSIFLTVFGPWHLLCAYIRPVAGAYVWQPAQAQSISTVPTWSLWEQTISYSSFLYFSPFLFCK